MSCCAEIIYTLIVWDYVPLAHYTAFLGTFKHFVQKMADKMHHQHQQKLTYQYVFGYFRQLEVDTLVFRYHNYMIHCLVNETEPRFGFICMTGDQYPQLLAFTYLNELRSQFLMYLSKNWKELDRNATVRCKPFWQPKLRPNISLNSWNEHICATNTTNIATVHILPLRLAYLGEISPEESLSDSNFVSGRERIEWNCSYNPFGWDPSGS